MGGLISKIRFNRNSENDDELKIKKYEEDLASESYISGFDDFDKNKKIVKWWEYFVFDVRARIVYSLILAFIIGIAVPVIVHYARNDSDDTTIYGSCFVEQKAVVQCLINQKEVTTENDCMEAMCCWQENGTLPYKCYHSFPSAYQYTTVRTFVRNESMWTIDAQANHRQLMEDLRITLRNEENSGNLVIEMQSIDLEQDPEFDDNSDGDNPNIFPGQVLMVEYASAGKYFYIRVFRKDTDETIFDTRLGPLHASESTMQFATLLSTPYYYGLPGGTGYSARRFITQKILNGFGNAELPFYLALEDSGYWHGLLVETPWPLIAQVVGAPGIMYHVEGNFPKVALRFFAGVGNHSQDILNMVHEYIQSQTQRQPYVPPNWSLGLHLCRMSSNGTEALAQILALANSSIPYDTDCIDDQLRLPFLVDSEKHEYESLEETLQYLKSHKKRVLLSQKLFYSITSNITSETSNYFIQNGNTAYEGSWNGYNVSLIDVFHPNMTTWLTEQLYNDEDSNNETAIVTEMLDNGVVLTDNFPVVENAGDNCPFSRTRLQDLMLQIQWRNMIVGLPKWGSVCPASKHKWSATETKDHWELHNQYGGKGLEKFASIMSLGGVEESGRQDLILSSDSVDMFSLSYGMFNGLQVPFTWTGLRESLSHMLRNFGLMPLAGTPICGSFHVNSSEPALDQDLCLRWFQLAMFLPFARNTYGLTQGGAWGPLDFSFLYRQYLEANILQRHQFAPYYFNQIHVYETTLKPPIRPLSYNYHQRAERQSTFAVTDQFLVGDDLLIIPIVTTESSRNGYFPRGIWYQLDGSLAWNNNTAGGNLFLNALINSAHIFIRGGSVIPTLHDPKGLTLEDSLTRPYDIWGALDDQEQCTGWLHIRPYALSPATSNGYEVNFTFNSSALNIRTENPICDEQDPASHTIDQIKLLGFPKVPSGKKVVVSSSDTSLDWRYNAENDVLRIFQLTIDWCVQINVDIFITIEDEDE